MPHFFRHFAPKIASKLYFNSGSQGSSNPNKFSSIIALPRRRTKPVLQWHDHYDTSTMDRDDSYLELNPGRKWPRPTTTIHGGEDEHDAERKARGLDHPALEAGIVKTERLAQNLQKAGVKVSHAALSP